MEAAYFLGQVFGRNPSLGFLIGGAAAGGAALLNSSESSKLETGEVIRNLSQCNGKNYVVLTGRIHAENCSEIRGHGLPGSIGDLKISKIISNIEVVHSTFRSDVSPNDPRFDNKFETCPPKEITGNKRFKAHTYSLILASGERVSLQDMDKIKIDGQILRSSDSQRIFHNYHELFNSGNGKFQTEYNYIPDDMTISIAGEITKISENCFILSKPLGKPYLVTIKKIEAYTKSKKESSYVLGILGIAFLGMSAYLKAGR